MNKKLGIYVHIPFCRAKCSYCDFYSVTGSDNLFGAYSEALKTHIREAAEQLAECDVDTIYFGGGTPTHFGAKRLCAVLNEIAKRFYITEKAEITFEANPESLDVEDALRLRRDGFNRVWIGVQSNDNLTLRQLGRPHTWERAKRAVRACRDAGFQNLSIDLMYGLPGHTLKKMGGLDRRTDSARTRAYLLLRPETRGGHALFERRAELELPDDDCQADMYAAAVERLDEERSPSMRYRILPGRDLRRAQQYEILDAGEYLGFERVGEFRPQRPPLCLC